MLKKIFLIITLATTPLHLFANSSSDQNRTNAIRANKKSDPVVANIQTATNKQNAPKVCYDYSIVLGEHIDIPSIDRNFSINSPSGNLLQLKIMLSTQESEFDLVESKLNIEFTPSGTLKYKKGSAQTTIPYQNSYSSAVEIDSNKGKIAIGENPTDLGGTFKKKTTIYTKFYYNFLNSSFSGKFDIMLNTKIKSDGTNRVSYQMSTQAPKESMFHIKRCDSNPTYNPIYWQFNVERGDSTFLQPEDKRYPLYTQIVGVPYKISIASYTKDDSGRYTKPIKTKSIVELELINSSNFNNSSSLGFDSICKDPDSYSKGVFVDFKNRDRVYLNIPKEYPTYPKDLALKSAAFRVWVLTKKGTKKRVALNHSCTKHSDSICFDKLYSSIYKNAEDSSTKFCLSSCSNSSNTECYDCLKKHFAIPVCSRDNFSIRPDSYSIAILDNNQTQNSTQINIGINSGVAFKDIAAGYLYSLDINATKYRSRDSTKGYYFSNKESTTSLKRSIAQFTGLPLCTNRKSFNLNISIVNGKTEGLGLLDKNSTSMPKNRVIIRDTSDYKIDIEDNEWTKVDQKGYKYKPFPNSEDCIKSSSLTNASSLTAKRGCSIKTGLASTYPKLKLRLHPFSFNIDSIIANSNPNSSSSFVYINDLNTTKSLIKNNSVMALRVYGDIVAIGKDGSKLQNYTNNCSAYDLNIEQNYSTDTLVKSSLNYAIYDKTVDTNSSLSVMTPDKKNMISLQFKKSYFYKPSTGSYSSYYNFKREYNNPINPFNISFSKIFISSPKEKISANMQKNYTPNATKDLNTTKTILYAKIKSTSSFYDGIYTNSINTPIEVNLFCNKSLEYCSKYGIDVSKGLTNEYNWWLALKHNGFKDGKALLRVNNPTRAKLEPTETFDEFVAGVDSRAKVTKKVGIELPYTVYIQPSNSMATKYPWLLYNRFNNTPPEYITKIRFVKSANSWSGEGKAGYSTNNNTTKRRTKKVDW